MEDNILEIKNLTVSFKIDDKYFKAVDNVSFNFKKGKMHAIVGESGSGKTVSMMTILGLLAKNSKIDFGEILFQNENLLNFNDSKMQTIRGKKIALIPQDPMTSLNPLYTIENQMKEVLKDNKNASEIIYNALKDVEIKNIETVLKSYPHELSGGMKQRIIIAIALILGAEIIIADEPTTALDVTIQAQILELLNKIKNEGKTIILITHNLGIVSKYCDDVSVMYKGQIVEKADTSCLFKNPKHPYTKALIKSVPNFNTKKLENIKGNIAPITQIIDGCSFRTRCNCAFDKCSLIKPELIPLSDLSNVACLLYLK